MRDLTDELAALHAADPPEVSGEQVAADLARGRAALRRRRVVAALSTLTVLAVAGAIGGVVATSTPSGPNSVPNAAGTVQASSPSRSSVPSGSAAPSSLPKLGDDGPSLQLVAWRGKQLKGFSVKTVPAGYVLQGVSNSVLVIAPPRLTTPLDDFRNKLVVMLDQQPTRDGIRLQVGSSPAWFRSDGGTQTLTYDAFGRHVHIQAWQSIDISRAQLVAFARGVTVTADAQPGNG